MNKKLLTSIPASRSTARSVPSAMSPAWRGKVTLRPGLDMTLDFVTAGSGPVEPVPVVPQPTRDIPVPESGETTHLRHTERHAQVDTSFWLDQIRKGRWKRVAMLNAGLGDLAGEPLGYLRGFGDAPPFGDKTRNVNACGQKTALGQLLDAETDGGLVHDQAISGHRSARQNDPSVIGIILRRSFGPSGLDPRPTCRVTPRDA